MDNRLFETILKGDVQNFLNLVQEDEAIIKQTVAESLNTILHLAARFGHEELASEIMKLCPEMVAAQNEKLETPMHEACREGRLNIVRIFLETDSWVVHKVNRNKESPFYVACERGKLDVVKQMLSCPWVLLLEMDGLTTPLHVAALSGHTDIVKELLEARPEFARKKDPNGYTPLHLSCSKGLLEITKELLNLDPDLSSLQDNEGRTPLHWAAIRGRINIIDELLAVNLQSSEIRTLHGETVLHLAVKNNQFEAVKHLTETLNITKLVNLPDNDGNTILHLATAGKLTCMVIYLLKLGVNVNAINLDEYTALDVVECDASNRDALLIVSALQEAGGKRCDQFLPMSPVIQVQPGDDTSQRIRTSSRPKRVPESPSVHLHHGHQSNREKKIELQDEGLRNARKTIIVVAVLIATVTFAAGINPPGGYNQVNGKSIVGKQTSFKVFMVCNILALFLSLGIVILLVSNIHIGRKSLMKLLAVIHKLMWLSTSLMAAAYIAAVWTVMPHGIGMVWVLVVLVSVGGGCTLAIFTGLGVLSVRHWFRIRKLRKSSCTLIGEGGTQVIAQSIALYETSDSELDSSDQGGYHLY